MQLTFLSVKSYQRHVTMNEIDAQKIYIFLNVYYKSHHSMFRRHKMIHYQWKDGICTFFKYFLFLKEVCQSGLSRQHLFHLEKC